jgi:DNA-binding transcriptional MerR regulator
MIRIGDFSKLSRVSIKTLRYYDEMDLLKPVEVDRFTGYRYYDFNQLPHLYRILALRELGFSLEEIGKFLKENLSTEALQGMLKLRQSQIRQQVEEEMERLAHVESWLRQTQQENFMSTYDVILKKIEPIKVVTIRDTLPNPPAQRSLWEELMAFIYQNGIRMNGTPMAIYHDDETRDGDWDIEVAMPIANDVTPTNRINVYTLPTVEKMACVVHAGSFATIGEAYDALAKWIDMNGYQIVGPSRELNLKMPENPEDQNDSNTVNELQFPVQKV